MTKKTHILGLGNTILTDDGVGIYVVRRLKERLQNMEDIDFCEASVGGFNFIDLLAGYQRAVVIDAIHTNNGKPGEFYELDTKALKPSARLSSLHQIDFATACDLADKMGIDFPREIAIFVMEVQDEFSFGEHPTEEVEAAIPEMTQAIIEALIERDWLKTPLN